jgi:hypothetical protein
MDVNIMLILATIEIATVTIILVKLLIDWLRDGD